MQLFKSVVAALNKNSLFRFASSVQLAIPLMLLLGGVVAWGTVLESQYNAEYANLIIYNSQWFSSLLGLLWLNIFFATLSRFPYKKHHLGFVITHIGLLTLLMGGFITKLYGIDGQLTIRKGQSSRSVSLPQLAIEIQKEGSSQIQKIKVERNLVVQDQETFAEVNSEIHSLFTIKKYLPFVQSQPSFNSSPENSQEWALRFGLKSPFFNLKEWLSTPLQKELPLGPVTVRLVPMDGNETENPKKNFRQNSELVSKNDSDERTDASPEKEPEDLLLIRQRGSQSLSATLPLKKLRHGKVSILGMTIVLTKEYRAAVVSKNKITENEDPSASNPALELQISKASQTLREVIYARFSGFSLNQEGIFGYELEYQQESGKGTESRGMATSTQPQSGPESVRPGSRLIEFRVSSKNPQSAEVVLLKEEKEVTKKTLANGETFITPWMGIELSIDQIVAHAVTTSDIKETQPEPKQALPPSAVLLQLGDGNSHWLAEGEQKSLRRENQTFYVYYGREIFELPFDLQLQNFSKVDYPGTTTALSFESQVDVNNSGSLQTISMNEPLKKDGFTIYQSSYILNPNEPPISIFSVNRDPGRWIKYLGSFILSVGIVIHTLIRSRRRASLAP